jgi:predicted class III extradiol MEMO1 family dioxygenase
MLDNNKVDQFYDFLSKEYYSENKPDTIVIISPNHFHTDEKEIKTICENSLVNYKSETVNLSAKLHKL